MNTTRDNLYKWYVISGLVIGLFALSVPYRFVDGLTRRSMPLEIATRRSEIEANDLFQKTDQLSKALKAEGQTNASGQVEYTMSDDEQKAAAKTLADQQLVLNIKFTEIKTSNAELSRLQNLTTGVIALGVILFLAGLCLFICGLRQWHAKIQSIHDFMLQNDLDKIASDKLGKK